MSAAHEFSSGYTYTPESWDEVQIAAMEAHETGSSVQAIFDRLIDLQLFGSATYYVYAETARGSSCLYAGKTAFGADDTSAEHNISRIIVNATSPGKGGRLGCDIHDYFLNFDTGELMLVGSRVELKPNADEWQFKLSTGPSIAHNMATHETQVHYGLSYPNDLHKILKLSKFPENVSKFLEDTAPFLASRYRASQQKAATFRLYGMY